jgi:hypothetical protein
MMIRMNGALRLSMVASALGGLVIFASAPAAMAQRLRPWRAAFPGEVERSLEREGMC